MKAQSFEYRGFHVDRVSEPSKNHRIGNILTFWRVRELASKIGSLCSSRPEAKRFVDHHLDGDAA